MLAFVESQLGGAGKVSEKVYRELTEHYGFSPAPRKHTSCMPRKTRDTAAARSMRFAYWPMIVRLKTKYAPQ